MEQLKKKLVYIAALFFMMQGLAASEPLRIIMIGAHPDDCEVFGGGTAALFSQMGHRVKFVSLTNGDKGHQSMKSPELAARRAKEMQEVARIMGIEYEHLDNHDGELQPTVENRKKVIRMICDWKADIVITHRPNDYHPDHRYASALVQDAAYMISVPLMVEGGEPLLKEPLFLYSADGFTKPNRFSPDIVIDITPAVKTKIDAIYAHESQMFEWLPWNEGILDKIPADRAGREQFLTDRYLKASKGKFNDAAKKWYSPEQLEKARYLEAFEICEYGKMPSKEDILQLFPMLPR